MTDFPIDWRKVVAEAFRRRKEEGLTQRSLAALAGVSPPTVNAFERGDVTLRFERIVAILDALGLFVQPGRSDGLQSFIHDARARWRDLVEDIPEDGASRLPHGFSEQAYSIAAVEPPPTLSALRELLARGPRTSGWPPFWVPSRTAIKPVVRDGAVETWLGRRGADRFFSDAAHSDFWRISREPNAYLRRGYQEDGSDFEPATIFDLTLPIWRTGEVLLHGAWLARALGGDGSSGIRFIARYAGLAGRELLSWAKPTLRLPLEGRRRARTDEIELADDTTLAEIEDAPAEVVARVLRPLYERFDGYDPPSELFRGQIADLLANRADRH